LIAFKETLRCCATFFKTYADQYRPLIVRYVFAIDYLLAGIWYS